MAMISKKNSMPHRPGREEAGKEPFILRTCPIAECSPSEEKIGRFGSEAAGLPIPAREEQSCHALVAVVPGGETPAADCELLRLRERAVAEIGALRSEIERLAEMKEETRTDLRRLLEDCLARLDGGGAGPGKATTEELVPVSPETAAEADEPNNSFSRLLFCNPLRRRLAVAGWDQAPMFLVLTLIILQQLVPTIQRMALLG